MGWVNPSTHPAVSYKDEKGVMQPTWEIFSLREYHKRVYALLRDQIGQTRILVNVAGSQIEMPLFSFVDVIWNGEQLACDPDDCIAIMPLATWRAGFSRKRLGNVPLFIAGLRHMTPGPAEDKANYSMATLLYLHDQVVFFSHYKSEIIEPF